MNSNEVVAGELVVLVAPTPPVEINAGLALVAEGEVSRG
jgi:hypothetical protein